MSKYSINDCNEELYSHQISNWKEVFYKFLRPVFNLIIRRYLDKDTLSKLKPNFVFGTHGMPLNFRYQWGFGGNSLKGKTIIIQGVGNGWETLSLAKFKPRKIIGIDLYSFDSWVEIQTVVKCKYGIEVEFYVKPLHKLDFLDNNSIDVVVSNACYEHVKNLQEVMEETYRILRHGGLVCSIYGPLWFCAGGDHFNRQGKVENMFNHLLLEPKEYQNYFNKYKKKIEDFQSGGRYIEIDLFSKLRTNDYQRIFRNAGFLIDGLILEVSAEAVAFKHKNKKLFKLLCQKHPHCIEDDFLIKTNFVRLVKK